MAGKFEIYKDTSGGFRFRLKAANGQNIMASQGYASQAACSNGIASVQRNAGDAGQYERKAAKNGKQYFVLKAKNHQIVAQSQMYTTAAAMEAGIRSAMKNGASDKIEDLTA